MIPDPDTWLSADDLATAAQLRFLRGLVRETKDSIRITDEMTKAEAYKQISRLKEKRDRARARKRASNQQCIPISKFVIYFLLSGY